jgi:hypothetical protein
VAPEQLSEKRNIFVPVGNRSPAVRQISRLPDCTYIYLEYKITVSAVLSSADAWKKSDTSTMEVQHVHKKENSTPVSCCVSTLVS